MEQIALFALLGLGGGSLIAGIALGVVLTYRGSGIINIATGAVAMLAVCLGLVGYIARKMLLDDARDHVVQNARIIMETMLSSRTYTTKQVAPLLQQKNFKGLYKLYKKVV